MRANRVDNNQKEVVKLLTQNRCSVLNISSLKNCCDLMVSKNGHTVAVEIKDGSKPPSQRRLTEGEQAFERNWLGAWRLIETLEDATKLVNELDDESLLRGRVNYKD